MISEMVSKQTESWETCFDFGQDKFVDFISKVLVLEYLKILYF